MDKSNGSLPRDTHTHTHTHTHTPQVILYSVPCNVLHWTDNNNNHRLRGSASPVLTATHHSYGSPRFSEFFRLTSGGQTPQPIWRKMAQTTWYFSSWNCNCS